MLEENLENTFASDPYNQMGGYLRRCLGLKMLVKVENPAGIRIQSFFIGDQLVDDEKICFVSFVTIEGVPKKYGTNRKNLDLHVNDALKEYLKKNPTVSPGLRDTVTLL